MEISSVFKISDVSQSFLGFVFTCTCLYSYPQMFSKLHQPCLYVLFLPTPDLILCHRIYLESPFTYKFIFFTTCNGYLLGHPSSHTLMAGLFFRCYSLCKHQPPSVRHIGNDTTPNDSLLAQMFICSRLGQLYFSFLGN